MAVVKMVLTFKRKEGGREGWREQGRENKWWLLSVCVWSPKCLILEAGSPVLNVKRQQNLSYESPGDLALRTLWGS